jgi:cytochrome P450
MSDKHLLELTSYFIDRGFAIREPEQKRISNWLVPILERLPKVTIAPQLKQPNFSMEKFDDICASADRPEIGSGPTGSCLLHDSKDVHALFQEPIERFVPGDLQVMSMALFQPKSLASTTDSKDFKVRRLVNENVLNNDQHAHANAEHYLKLLEQEVDRFQPAGGILRWGDVDQITRETALMVVWGRRDHSLRNRVDEMLRQANMAGLLALLKPLLTNPSDLHDLIKLFPTDMRERASIILKEGKQGEYLEEHQNWIHRRIESAGKKSLASLLVNQLKPKGSLPKDEAADQLTHWLFAARGTVTVHTAYALCFVAANKQLQQTLIGALHQSHGSLQDIQQSLASGRPSNALQMIENLSLEAGRLFPAVPFMARKWAGTKSERPDFWQDDCPNYMVHNKGNNRRSEMAGNEPEKVKIDRWRNRKSGVDPKVKRIKNGPTMFGGGSKRCPGMNLGLLLSTGLVAQLLLEYRFDAVRNSAPGQSKMNTDNVPETFDQFGIELIVQPRR